jgi:hypothetical protein
MDYEKRYQGDRIYARNEYRRPRRKLGLLPLLLLIPLLLLLGIAGPRFLNSGQNNKTSETLSQSEHFVSPVPTGTSGAKPQSGIGGAPGDTTVTVTPTRNDPTIESGAASATARNASEAQDQSSYPQQGIGGSGDTTTQQKGTTASQTDVRGSRVTPNGAPNTGHSGE